VSSGVGTSAIQLLKQVPDVNIFATAGSKEKIDEVVKLGATAGFNYKEGPWNAQLLPRTRSGKGVDIILDPVGKDYFQQDLDSLNSDGYGFALLLCGNYLFCS
jgi:tumor protein p53-inducible protein 3